MIRVFRMEAIGDDGSQLERVPRLSKPLNYITYLEGVGRPSCRLRGAARVASTGISSPAPIGFLNTKHSNTVGHESTMTKTSKQQNETVKT